jgi:hypothetical protein
LDPEIVGRELVKAGIVFDPGGLRLEPIPRNPERRDYLARASFRVLGGSRIVCHLTVGANLEDLWTRSRDFAAACPEIAARPLFLHRAGDTDYLGVEYIEGADLETLALQGQVKAAKASALVKSLVSCLEATFQDSTVSAALGEVDALFASLGESPVYSGLDQRFLQEFVFPLIRQGVRASPAQTRWTNGDFIPCNVRIDLQGRPRLVDYEFARRTHFHGEDALRWSFFSKGLPKEFRSIAPFDDSSYVGSAWLEAYFLLRQMHLSAETSGSTPAVGNTAAYVRDRLLHLVSAHHNGFQSSLFYKEIFAQLSKGPGGAPSGMAQLFWSADGTFGEERSSRLQIPYDRKTLLRFKLPPLSGPLHLRFDPIDATGLVHISALRVHLPRTEQTLLAIDGQTGWQGLGVCSSLHRLSDTPEFNSLSWSTDPFLLLPVLDLGPTEQEVAVDVGIRFTPKLEGLPSLLAPPAPAGPAQSRQQPESPEADRAGRLKDIEAIQGDYAAAAGWECELRQTLAQLEESGRNLEALEAAVSALRSEMLTAERAFHQALQDRSKDSAQLGDDKRAYMESLEAAVSALRGKLLTAEKAFHNELQGRLKEFAQLAANNSAYVESLLAQNDEIRRLEAVNRVAGEALIELRDQLTAAQRWLGELRNRAFVRLSLAIHREKWPS